VLGQSGAETFLASMQDLMAVVSVGYITEGKRFATLAIGCTGGKHRSSAMAEEFARRLRVTGLPTTVLHRDLGRELAPAIWRTPLRRARWVRHFPLSSPSAADMGLRSHSVHSAA
jgi:hypothetical protein